MAKPWFKKFEKLRNSCMDLYLFYLLILFAVGACWCLGVAEAEVVQQLVHHQANIVLLVRAQPGLAHHKVLRTGRPVPDSRTIIEENHWIRRV